MSVSSASYVRSRGGLTKSLDHEKKRPLAAACVPNLSPVARHVDIVGQSRVSQLPKETRLQPPFLFVLSLNLTRRKLSLLHGRLEI